MELLRKEIDSLKSTIKTHLETISSKETEVQSKQAEIEEHLASLKASEEKNATMLEALGSPMKHLEVFLASKEEKIASLEKSLNGILTPATTTTTTAEESSEPTVDVSTSNKITELVSAKSNVEEPDARDDAEAATTADPVEFSCE